MAEEELEQTALSFPMEYTLQVDADAYMEMIQFEVITVSRSALRIGRADSINSTSTLVLWFDYDGKQKSLSRRFKLHHGVVYLTSDFLKKPKLPENHFKALVELQEKEIAGESPSYFSIGVLYNFRYPGSGKAGTLYTQVQKTAGDKEEWNDYIPLSERRLLKDWLGYLKVVLSFEQPRRHTKILIGELFNSEGKERAIAAMKKWDEDRLSLFL